MKLMGGAMKLMERGHEMDGGGYEIDRGGGYEMDGGGL